MNLRLLRSISAGAILAIAGGRTLGADGAVPLHVAAASNLAFALNVLNAAFSSAHPEVRLSSTFGASGTLVTQIANGAPYDIFLSADREFAEKLVDSGHASASALRVFATGRLVFWTTRPDLDVNSIAAVIENPAVVKIAIANPETAPYGRAAMQALKTLHLWASAQPKLVRGENISQTAQFVETGNADAGFVALSLVLSPKLTGHGRWAEVGGGLYAPLEQVAVLTSKGDSIPSARDYLDFLASPEARTVLIRFGYRVRD